jgi:hypothetical protein
MIFSQLLVTGVLTVGLLFIISGPHFLGPATQIARADFNFAAVGDWGCNSNTKSTVTNIQGKKPERVLGLGDYSHAPTATCWLNTINPIETITRINIGNHENNADEGNSQYMNAFDNNTLLKHALKELVSEANSLLTKKPTSVVDKGEIPPSGDIHDFLSLAPYRWPDPSKKDGLPYIGRDGRINPEIYTIPDNRNLVDITHAVIVLSAAYYFTDEPKYASKAEELLRVWFVDNSTKMNPNLKYAETVRGKSNVYSGGIMVGRNLTDVIDAIGLIQDSPAWTKEDQAGVVSWFTKYLGWLMNSTSGKEEGQKMNNHGTYYYVQVAAIASFLNKTEIAKNTIEAFVQRPSTSTFIAPEKSLAVKIQPDGRQPFELQRSSSLQYSLFNLQGLFRLADIGQQLGIDLWNYTSSSSQGPLLQKALDFLMPYVLEKEPWPYSQISAISGHITAADLFCHAAISYPKMEGVYMKSFKYFIRDRPFFDVHNLPCLGR